MAAIPGPAARSSAVRRRGRSLPRRKPDEAVAEGNDQGFELRSGADLVENGAEEGPHRLKGYAELLCDLTVGEPLGDQLKDTPLRRIERRPRLFPCVIHC